MMHYKNIKTTVLSPDRDTDFFDIFSEVLQGDTLAAYMFIYCLEFLLRISIYLIKKKLFSRCKKG